MKEHLYQKDKRRYHDCESKLIYKGRQLNTIETPQQFLSKYNQSHLKLIKDKNYSIRKLASITNLANNVDIEKITTENAKFFKYTKLRKNTKFTKLCGL